MRWRKGIFVLGGSKLSLMISGFWSLPGLSVEDSDVAELASSPSEKMGVERLSFALLDPAEASLLCLDFRRKLRLEKRLGGKTSEAAGEVVARRTRHGECGLM